VSIDIATVTSFQRLAKTVMHMLYEQEVTKMYSHNTLHNINCMNIKKRKEQGETDLIIAQGRIVKKWWVSRTAQD